jgi:uncharacterized membrane protein YphA (DoxX/SURF4 family)
MFKKIISAISCHLLGVIFIVSGLTKLYPIEPFELTFVETGFINWQLAPFMARVLIGVEFIIGFLLFFNLNYKKYTYKFSILLLLLFCIYLAISIFNFENTSNCGCFGTYIEMSSSQALIKNAIMLLVLFFLHKYHTGIELKKNNLKWLLIPFSLCIALPFILNPVVLDYSSAYLNKPNENFKLELDLLNNNATLNLPPKKLAQGKQVIVFLSLTCKHCRIAANKLRILKQQNPTIPLYFVLNGKEENLKPFFDDTHSALIPHCMLSGKPFITLAGTALPSIYLVNNSIVEHNINYFEIDKNEIENWLKRK